MPRSSTTSEMRWLKGLVMLLVIFLAGWNLYKGLTVQEMGIPGIFTVKFWKPNDNASGVENVAGGTPTPAPTQIADSSPAPTGLSADIEQVEITPQTGGGVQLFIFLVIKNYGQRTTIGKYSLQIAQVGSQRIDVKVPAEGIKKRITLRKGRTTLPQAGGDRRESLVIQPKDDIANNTVNAVETGGRVGGWTWFSVPLPILTPEDLRQPGTKFTVSFTDNTGKTYQVSYQVL